MCILRTNIRNYYRNYNLIRVENVSELNNKFEIIQDDIDMLAEEYGKNAETWRKNGGTFCKH